MGCSALAWARDRLERAKQLRPKCPECGAEQVQLTDWSTDPTAAWVTECSVPWLDALIERVV